MQLQKDVENADEMLFDNNVIELNRLGSQINYIISDSLILRSQDKFTTDSFSYKTHEIQVFPLENDEFDRIAVINLQVEVVDEVLTVTAEKKYSASQLLNCYL